MTTRIEHYKNQRDLLAYYLLEVMGISKIRLAQILGMSRQAVDMQFPNRQTDDEKAKWQAEHNHEDYENLP